MLLWKTWPTSLANVKNLPNSTTYLLWSNRIMTCRSRWPFKSHYLYVQLWCEHSYHTFGFFWSWQYKDDQIRYWDFSLTSFEEELGRANDSNGENPLRMSLACGYVCAVNCMLLTSQTTFYGKMYMCMITHKHLGLIIISILSTIMYTFHLVCVHLQSLILSCFWLNSVYNKGLYMFPTLLTKQIKHAFTQEISKWHPFLWKGMHFFF